MWQVTHIAKNVHIGRNEQTQQCGLARLPRLRKAT
jgi:hypothetical protein